MAGDIKVRDSEPGDLAAMRDIYAHAVRHGSASFERDPPDLAEIRARRARLVEKGYPYVVAVKGNDVVGFAYAGPYRTRPAYEHSVESSVYVRKNFQGLGIGRALLSEIVVQAETRGFRQMVAIIGDSANIASIALHESQGFRLVGTLQAVGWKHGRWLDTVIMQRALGHGATAPAAC